MDRRASTTYTARVPNAAQGAEMSIRCWGQYTIQCDGDHDFGKDWPDASIVVMAYNEHGAMEQAKAHGWSFHDGEHFCPRCTRKKEKHDKR